MNTRAWFSSIRRSAAAGNKGRSSDYVYAESWRGPSASDPHIMAAVRRHRRTHSLGTRCCGRQHSQTWAVSHRRAGRALDSSYSRSARTGDSLVGKLLSLVLSPVVGVCLLLFGKQLRDGWLWRRDPAFEVADVGAAREHHRRIDVRNICKSSVCDCHAARRP